MFLARAVVSLEEEFVSELDFVVVGIDPDFHV